MNIQIFGKSKCFDTKKAERFFKERGIKFQSINLEEKGFSPREFESVKRAIGSLDAFIDTNVQNADALLLRYLSGEAEREEKLLQTPSLMRTPIVRNGQQATIGYAPEVWETWE